VRIEAVESVRVTDFDGRSWERPAHEVAHLSKDGVTN
jgi:hypothetical protein